VDETKFQFQKLTCRHAATLHNLAATLIVRILHSNPWNRRPDRPGLDPEIKHDGYRMIVHRVGKRVWLFTRNGHDWTDRYPLIVKAALKNRASSFVIDG
jgi:hypothetical protein